VSASFPRIRTRLITALDVNCVADLLAKGFPRRTRQFWQQALDRLAKHSTPAGLPKFGYLMESNGAPVGVILLIFSAIETSTGCRTRCNVSSWYVEPRYRTHATLLVSQALKHENVTYLNISPADHVRPIVEAQGFKRYSNGQVVAVPALCPPSNRPRKLLFGETRPDVPFESFERELLLTHAQYGCISLWCTTSDRAYPFVFLPRNVKGFIPCTQLIYCRSIQDFVQFAGKIGRFLAARGRPLLLIDSNGPIPGLLGKYYEEKAPKYFKGSDRPRLGDLAYTEAAMFGL
jgi:hypothetical protein